MTIKDHLNGIWGEINNIKNWNDHNFDWKKAYVASLFAKIAYMHIPAYELKNVDRSNLIPCAEYREIIKEQNRIGVGQILSSAEFGEYFIVERPQVVAIVIKIRDIIFISLRGTQQAYDWLVNLNVSKSRPYPDANSSIYFHKGFHRAIASCMYEIYLGILQRFGFGEKTTIYATGHSLGGALAAILYATWIDRFSNKWRFHHRNKHFLPIHACYTFGMPRFGNFDAVNHFKNPFHIYNQNDIVPNTPPKRLDFDDSLIEYCLTSENEVDGTNIKVGSFAQFIYKLAVQGGIQNHDMEIYINRTKNLASNPDTSAK